MSEPYDMRLLNLRRGTHTRHAAHESRKRNERWLNGDVAAVWETRGLRRVEPRVVRARVAARLRRRKTAPLAKVPAAQRRRCRDQYVNVHSSKAGAARRQASKHDGCVCVCVCVCVQRTGSKQSHWRGNGIVSEQKSAQHDNMDDAPEQGAQCSADSKFRLMAATAEQTATAEQPQGGTRADQNQRRASDNSLSRGAQRSPRQKGRAGEDESAHRRWCRAWRRPAWGARRTRRSQSLAAAANTTARVSA